MQCCVVQGCHMWCNIAALLSWLGESAGEDLNGSLLAGLHLPALHLNLVVQGGPAQVLMLEPISAAAL